MQLYTAVPRLRYSWRRAVYPVESHIASAVAPRSPPGPLRPQPGNAARAASRMAHGGYTSQQGKAPHTAHSQPAPSKKDCLDHRARAGG